MEQSGFHVEPIHFVDKVAEFVAYTVRYLNKS